MNIENHIASISIEQAIKALPYVTCNEGLFASGYGISYTVTRDLIWQDAFQLVTSMVSNLSRTVDSDFTLNDDFEFEDANIITTTRIVDEEYVIEYLNIFSHYTLFWYDKQSLEGITDFPEWIEGA